MANARSCLCRECGHPFSYAGPGRRPPITCSETCRVERARRRDRERRPRMTAFRTGTCRDCDAETVAGRAGAIPARCPPCTELYNDQVLALWSRRRPLTVKYKDCTLCGALYVARGRDSNSKYCRPCREGIHHLYRQNRATRLAVEAESFAPHEIYERDGWVCQLCRKPVSPEARWGDPWYASIDHIIPLVHGGRHTRTNVQLAHQLCNRRKWAHIPGEVICIG